MAKVTSYSATQFGAAVHANGGLLFVHFASALASSCDVVRQEFEQMVSGFEGLVEFAEVEVSLSDMRLIRNFQLEQIPTLALFRGRQEVERLETLLAKDDLEQFLLDCVSYYTGGVFPADTGEADAEGGDPPSPGPGNGHGDAAAD